MNTVGKNLKTLRKRSGMKQEDLAEKIHVTRQTISNYETGRRAVDVVQLNKICNALDVDMIELLTKVVNMDVGTLR